MTDNPYLSPIETKLPNAEDFSAQFGGVGARFLARYDQDFTPPTTFTPDKDTFALYLFTSRYTRRTEGQLGEASDRLSY